MLIQLNFNHTILSGTNIAAFVTPAIALQELTVLDLPGLIVNPTSEQHASLPNEVEEIVIKHATSVPW